MTTIEELREEHGAEPVRVKPPFLVEVSGHKFGLYLNQARSTKEFVSGNVALDGGTLVPLTVSRDVEELFELKRMHVHVDVDHLDFYTGFKHVADYNTAKRFLDDEVERIVGGYAKEQSIAKDGLEDDKSEHATLKKIADRWVEDFIVDPIATDRRYERMDLLEKSMAKHKRILAKTEPDKPADSFKIAIMTNAPLPLRLDVLGGLGDSERDKFLKLFGVVPILPVDIQVEGLLRARVLLRP